MDPEPLHRTVPARAEEIAPLRRAVQHYAETVNVADPFVVALAVSEMVTNVVLHAYTDRPDPGHITVSAVARPDDGLELTVADDGRGMTPRPDSPGLGLGLPLIAHLTDHFEVREPPGGGTQVRMVFPRRSEPATP